MQNLGLRLALTCMTFETEGTFIVQDQPAMTGWPQFLLSHMKNHTI